MPHMIHDVYVFM